MLRILTVDDERLALNHLNHALAQAVPEAQVNSFTSVRALIAGLRDGGFCPDVTFLDIEMPGMNGLELAGALKVMYPQTNIIFVTGFSQYALDAYALRPSGYLTKPVSPEDILLELRNLRNPPKRTVPGKPVFIRCFGTFEVFLNGQYLHFSRAKSKELLAYLIDRRGSYCSLSEISAALWEDGLYDRSRQKQISVIRHDLLKTLEQAGVASIIQKERNALAVDCSQFDCDYYQALSGDSAAINSFAGEYLSQYSWAEFTNATLFSKFPE